MRRLASAVFLAAISTAASGEDGLSLTAGFDYTTGKYGNAASTDILYVPVTAKYVSGDLTLKLTVPYISVTGPGGVIQGFGRVGGTPAMGGGGGFGRPAGGGATATTTHAGLGDIVASAGYTVYTGDALSLDAVGKVKLATADASQGLGTGANDYSAQLDGYYALSDRSTLLMTGGYKIVGAPSGLATHNVFFGMLGFDRKTSAITSVGLMYDFMQSPATGVPGQRIATLYATRKLSNQARIQYYVLKGFTDSSPDYGGGVMVTSAF